jgi:hypothetical protein
MPKGDKYLNLKIFLQKSGQPIIKITFEEIECIIHDSLPPSASKHSEPWWSNNKDHSQAISWLEAGYETDYVTDTYKEKYITFVKRD